MDTLRICRECHTPLAANVVGPLCPKCAPAQEGIVTAQTQSGAVPPPPSVAKIAEFFPQLEIYELIGHGGMGMVYKARQLNLDRLVALKILSPELSSQPAFAERFSREAKAMARLHHSNIVAIYDFGRAGPYYYFLMEYVDGVDLHTLIHQKELKPPEALRVVAEICHALQFAHGEGIIHRDIKPANILIDKKGRVKMADFGLSKLLGDSGGKPLPALTQTTGLLGTPQYMAPEQVERPAEVDQRADLYSLGVIFYEMLTGELPLGRFPLPSQKAHVDARLDAVVLRALEKEPRLRYQQASEILTQVERFATPTPEVKRDRKMAMLRQIGITVAAVVIAVSLYALTRGHPYPPPPGPPGPPGMLSVFTNTPDGLSVSARTITDLKLKSDQLDAVNSIVRSAERDVAQIERKHAERTLDSNGHIHVVIKPFEAQARQVAEQMWKELGTVLTSAQMDDAKRIPFERQLIPPTVARTVNVEMWKDAGGEYHFTDTTESARAGETSRSIAGTNFNVVVPRRYRTYWGDTP